MTAIQNDKTAVLKLHEDVINYFNALDLDALLGLHAENIVLMEPGMPVIIGKTEVQKLFKKLREQNITFKLSYSIQEIEVFGTRAFVRGQVIKNITKNNEATCETGKFITLSQKQDNGRWLRTHVMVNNDE